MVGSPTLHRAVGAHSAGVVPSGVHRDESARGRRRPSLVAGFPALQHDGARGGEVQYGSQVRLPERLPRKEAMVSLLTVSRGSSGEDRSRILG